MKVLLSTHKRKLTIETLIRRIEQNCFTFESDTLDNRTELATSAIELILSGIDIPTALALEDENGKYKIAAQGNALSALLQFIGGDFSLGKSNLVEGVSHKSFNELTIQAQNRILDYQASLSACLAPASTDEEVSALVKSFKALQ